MKQQPEQCILTPARLRLVIRPGRYQVTPWNRSSGSQVLAKPNPNVLSEAKDEGDCDELSGAKVEGDCDEGVYPIGQVTGLIEDNPTVAELMERIAAEARQVQAKLGDMLAE